MADRNKTLHDTEDKTWWCQHGIDLEERFVRMCNERLGIEACINPQKSSDQYAPDLVVRGTIADLKVQNTPFFTAKRYGLEPRKTVTFNRKDYLRYRSLYPEIDIFFWVDWQQTEWKGQRVDHLVGVYRLPFQRVSLLIESGAPEHGYIHRQGDQAGNAKSSFLLRLDDFEAIFERSGDL